MHEIIHKYQQSSTTVAPHYCQAQKYGQDHYANLECFPVLLFECLLLPYY